MSLSKAISKWTKLSNRRRFLLLRASFVLFVIGSGLKFLSFSAFKKWYFKISGNPPVQPVKSEQEVEDIVWAVETAARALPMNLMCLPQSLAVKYLLGRSEGVVIHIGVNKIPGEDFRFHAWVEQKGKTIIGDLPAYYQPMWVWD